MNRNDREQIAIALNTDNPIYNKYDPINGKRYRLIGCIKDYEPEMVFNGMSVPISQTERVKKQFQEGEQSYERK